MAARDVAQDLGVGGGGVGLESNHLTARVALEDRNHDLGFDPQLAADICVLRKASRGSEIEVNICPKAPLVENGSDLLTELPGGLQREQQDRLAIRHRRLRAQQGQRMAVPGSRGQLPQQGGVVDRQHLARWRLDIQRQAGCIGGNRIEQWRKSHRLSKVGLLGCLLRVAEARLVEQHLVMLPPGQIWKAGRRGGALEGK
jgi:hypothetical protein